MVYANYNAVANLHLVGSQNTSVLATATNITFKHIRPRQKPAQSGNEYTPAIGGQRGNSPTNSACEDREADPTPRVRDEVVDIYGEYSPCAI